MKSRNLIGIVLVVFGIISLCYAGIDYTHREKVFQVGSLVATADKTDTIPLSPVVGAIALVAGVVVLATGG